MTARLNQSVLAGGVVYPAGQEATDELRQAIPAQFWDGAEGSSTSYAGMKKADLEAEVASRNESRDADALIVVDGKGTVADLVAALEADDAAAQG